MKTYRNIVGARFGWLTVVSRDETYKDGKHTKWLCVCDCGNTTSVTRDALLAGRTQSCGCQQYKGKKGTNKTHGMSQTRIYREWASMKQRCSPTSQDRNDYYCRGITVCEEWKSSFLSFFQWATANGYDDSLTIDRIDNNRGYSPDNCRWITIEQQQRNKTTTVYVEYNGENRGLKELCSEISFPYKTAHRRLRKMLNRGEKVDARRLFAPINKNKIAITHRT